MINSKQFTTTFDPSQVATKGGVRPLRISPEEMQKYKQRVQVLSNEIADLEILKADPNFEKFWAALVDSEKDTIWQALSSGNLAERQLTDLNAQARLLSRQSLDSKMESKQRERARLEALLNSESGPPEK